MFRKNGFTLIELLVVIAIIALLLSITLPALRKAKLQASLVLCTANTKQIGGLIQCYRADNKDFVPPVANRDAGDSAYTSEPAVYAYLSLGLRDYADLKGLNNTYLTQPYGPIGNPDLYQAFCDSVLPKFFACPFNRNKKVAPVQDMGQVTIGGYTAPGFKIVGRGESYATWRWGAYRDGIFPIGMTGISYAFKTPKFGSVPWVKWEVAGCSYQTAKNNQTKWDSSQFRRFGISGPFDMAIVYCEQGENNNWVGRSGPDWGFYNPGSHEKKGLGGTNVLFGDGHVEWVEGLRVGWP